MITKTANIAVVTVMLALAAACGSDPDRASTTSTRSATSPPEGIARDDEQGAVATIAPTTTGAVATTAPTTAAIATSSERPKLSGEEIRVTSDLIEYGGDLAVRVDSVASDHGRLYVLAGQVPEEQRALGLFRQTAVLAAFDDGVERWRIQLDGKPTDLVVVDGDPWVLQLDDNSVSRISSDDGRILGHVTLDAPVANTVLVEAYGTVWVAVTQESRSNSAVDLVRITPDLSFTTVALPSEPKIADGNDAERGERIADGADAVWVPLRGDGVAMVELDSNKVTLISADAIGHEVRDVAVHGDVAYVASHNQVTSIVDRQVVATVSFPSTSDAPWAVLYLGPLDGAFGVLLADGQFETLQPNDPMVVEHRELSASGQDVRCIEPLCDHTYGWDEIDGEVWIESLESTNWALIRLQLLPASEQGG
jgi:hypothetical protein